jgi:hypothetical protein
VNGRSWPRAAATAVVFAVSVPVAFSLLSPAAAAASLAGSAVFVAIAAALVRADRRQAAEIDEFWDVAGDACGHCGDPFDPRLSGHWGYCSDNCAEHDAAYEAACRPADWAPGLHKSAVVVCIRCGLDFDGQPDAEHAAYFAGVHNDLHHGSSPVAFVDTITESVPVAGFPGGPWGGDAA